MPWISSPSATDAPTVRRGLSEAKGSWKTICIRLRVSRSSSGVRVARSVPSKRTTARRGHLEPQHGASDGALAAARFADEGERFPGVDREGDVLDRLHGGVVAAQEPARAVVLDQTFDLERAARSSRRSLVATQHATWWPARDRFESRLCSRHLAIATGQRGWKRQPDGH